MANFQVAHGLSFAPASWVENVHFERLSTDPSLVAAGRVWFNTTDKCFKMSTLDGGGSVIVRTFATIMDLNTYKSQILATTLNASGASKIGYDGLVGSHAKFSVNPGLLDNTLDTVVQKIDDIQDGLDSAGGNTSVLQGELDNTQTGAGLAADGAYVANAGSNYASGAVSLTNADTLLDVQINTNTNALAQEVIDRQNADNLKVAKAGDSMTGNLDLGSNKVTGLAEPTSAQDAATKNYVDTTAQGLDGKASCTVATVGDLAATYENTGYTLTVDIDGALSIDGISPDVDDRVLVKDQTNAYENGIYTVTTVGDGSSQAVLTRAVDFDNNPAGEVTPGAYTFVEEGTTNENNGYTLITDGDITIGTTDLDFQQFSGAGAVLAGAGISKTGNEIFINFGAGIAETPSDEVGLDFYSTGGLFTTVDGSTSSTVAGSQVALNLDNSDAFFGATLTSSANGVRLAASITTDINGLHNELDASQTGAGLEVTGAYNSNTTANYINTAISLKDADNKLDAQSKVTADGLAQEIIDRQNAASAIQTELDATQTGAGLGTDGAYTANAGANYVASATSLLNADNVLDSAIKTVATNLNGEISNRQVADAALQTEIDSSQTGAGLSTTGDYQAAGMSNYISGATSIHNATIILDGRVKVNADDIAQEISDRQTSVTNMKNAINAKVFKQSYAAATVHSVQHNLNTSNVEYTVWIKDTDGKWKNDICGVTVEDNNNFTVELTESHEILIIIRSAEILA